MNARNTRPPVTVLSGFRGAGKGTLLNRVLNNRQGGRVAVIVKARLDAALLPAVAATGSVALPDLPDPFPAWGRAEAAA